MRGCEFQRIIDAIEGSKVILNRLVSSCEEDLSCGETLKASRELDELLNMYNSMFHYKIENSQEAAVAFYQDENSYYE